ncbi:MAG: DUF1688 family protein [Francisellaceae bacterium]|jgi:hypothetical protein|nr:DUF1688 family protein [Francisellaceae bacterium]MBT6207871.1 DUF1688 family protein [Francisellaceae bacterium]MBT6539423.1 DUF1688 family protein [Francisellaceae bacterium]
MNEQEVMSLYDISSIRPRARVLYDYALQDKLSFFQVNENNIEKASNLVLEVTQKNYPNLKIPYHSRWRHFEVVKNGLYKDVLSIIEQYDKKEAVKRKVELVILSALLDAGAGNSWQYNYKGTVYTRSEGLAVATLNAYLQGKLSAVNDPCGIGGKALVELTESSFCAAFQANENNPLIGVSNRVALMHAIGGELLETNHDSLFIAIFSDVDLESDSISIKQLFHDLLMFLVPLLPEATKINNIAVGDVGQHDLLKDDDNPLGLIPFHKLIQWICYSLIEPFTDAGITVTDTDFLTGLPEYRNGGLFSDLNVISVKDESLLKQKWSLSSSFVVEWRALTVVLLDTIRNEISKELDLEISMGMLLQGGSWEAGRGLAKKLRANAQGPYLMESHGTIF